MPLPRNNNVREYRSLHCIHTHTEPIALSTPLPLDVLPRSHSSPHRDFFGSASHTTTFLKSIAFALTPLLLTSRTWTSRSTTGTRGWCTQRIGTFYHFCVSCYLLVACACCCRQRGKPATNHPLQSLRLSPVVDTKQPLRPKPNATLAPQPQPSAATTTGALDHVLFWLRTEKPAPEEGKFLPRSRVVTLHGST